MRLMMLGVLRLKALVVCTIVLSLGLFNYLELTTLAQSVCTPETYGANANDWLPDDAALQQCLTAGGTVLLTASFPGYIVDGVDIDSTTGNGNDHFKGLRLSQIGTTLTTVGAPTGEGSTTFVRARILAGRHLFDQILRTTPITGVAGSFTIRYVEFHGMVDQQCNGDMELTDENNSLVDCANYPQETGDAEISSWRVRLDGCYDDGNPDNTHPGNLMLQGTNYSETTPTPFSFTSNHSVESLCGSGLGLYGHFTVEHNYVAHNGRPSDGPGVGEIYFDTRWSDGTSVLWCDHGSISHNTFVDNTDIDIAIFGSDTCTVASNTIAHLGKYGFAGLNPGNSPGGPPGTAGWHTNSLFYGNTISSTEPDKLAMGILIA
jgi:hypothetical protein